MTGEVGQAGSSGREPRVGVAVPAAGVGSRMGGRRKPYLELAGEPILLRSLRPFLAHPGVVAVVVALPPDDVDDPPAWLIEADPRVRVVPGGQTRTGSVRAALEALPDDVDVAVVHDGARPLVSAEVVARCIEVAAGGRGAVAGIPAVDTLKEVDADGRIVDTLDRSRIWHAQTPQAFPREMILDAYRNAEASVDATDDAGLVERIGGEVVMVRASPGNLKITRPADLPMAEALLRGDS